MQVFISATLLCEACKVLLQEWVREGRDKLDFVDEHMTDCGHCKHLTCPSCRR